MRYYIVSIVSIFLALGIGIFIGFMLDAQEILVNEKEDIVNKLELKFQSLEDEKNQFKAQLDTLTKENETHKKFSKDIFPKLIEGRLEGTNIVLIQVNDESNYSNISNMLEIAGANVNEITLYERNLLNNVNRLNAQLLGNEYVSTDDNTDNPLIQSFYPEVINQITSNKLDNIALQSIKRNLVRVKGKFEKKIDYFVVAGEYMDDDNKLSVYKGVTDYLMTHKFPVIMIQKDSLENSKLDLTQYFDKEIPTINDIDSILGKVSLVFTIESLKTSIR